MKKNDGPAYPRTAYYPDDPSGRLEVGERREMRTAPQVGLSKRELFAARFAAALATNLKTSDLRECAAYGKTLNDLAANTADMAVLFADALLERLARDG